jgi:polysaccharide export outer membrane protein
MRKLIFFGGILLLISSCVVNKKYQYLQSDDVNVKGDIIEKDSIIRTYDLSDFEYRLQPEDILAVQFYSLTPEEFNFFSLKGFNTQGGAGAGAGGNSANLISLLNGYLVDEEGMIEFPVVGKVEVTGLTIFEAQNKIQEIANQYLEHPLVEVRILNFRFTVLGEVKREGVTGNLNNRITLLEAIGLSGGFTDYADKSNVKIIRQSKGKAEVYYIDLLDESFVDSPYYYVNQNDIVVVPPLKQRPYQIYFGKNLALVISSVSLLLLVLNLVQP